MTKNEKIRLGAELAVGYHLSKDRFLLLTKSAKVSKKAAKKAFKKATKKLLK